MGMAASQARLLCLTARIHDVEHQAQAIQNAKLQLATRSDEVYEEYVAALDATTLTVSKLNADGSSSVIAATFNNLCSKNKIRPADGSNYALLDNRGRLIVSDEIFNGYKTAKELGINSPQAYAIFMMCGQVYNINPDITDSSEFNPTIQNAEVETYNHDCGCFCFSYGFVAAKLSRKRRKAYLLKCGIMLHYKYGDII